MKTNTLEDTWKKTQDEVRHRWDRVADDSDRGTAGKAQRLVGSAQRKVERGADQVLYKLGRRRRPASRLRRVTDSMPPVVNHLIDKYSWKRVPLLLGLLLMLGFLLARARSR